MSLIFNFFGAAKIEKFIYSGTILAIFFEQVRY